MQIKKNKQLNILQCSNPKILIKESDVFVNSVYWFWTSMWIKKVAHVVGKWAVKVSARIARQHCQYIIQSYRTEIMFRYFNIDGK